MNAGGAESFLMKLYRQLDKNKYQMDFCINTQEKCFYEDEILAMGGKIYRIPPKSLSVSRFRRELFYIVKQNDYIYVLRITSNALGFMDLKIASKAGAKICAARSSNSSDGNSIKSKIAHIIGKILYKKYVTVRIAPSDLAARYTFGNKAYKNGSVTILHNAIDLKNFCFDYQQRNAIRKEFGISNETTVIGHVGRFMPQKNHKFIVEIFFRYVKENPNSILFFVGKGELEPSIKKDIMELGLSDKVLFLGVRSDVASVLSAMDCFVLPSFYEGMPNVVIEAQATGLPCLVSDTVTREANVTGLVHYLPLDSATVWVDYISNMPKITRVTPIKKFKENCYDVETVTRQFAKVVFEE